jgi:hypothetical protein
LAVDPEPVAQLRQAHPQRLPDGGNPSSLRHRHTRHGRPWRELRIGLPDPKPLHVSTTGHGELLKTTV